MKVLLISLFIPSEHNIGGPSSLPYYLAKERPAEIKIDLMYYNLSETNENFLKGDLPAIFSDTRKIKRTPKLVGYVLKGLQKIHICPDLGGMDLDYLPGKKDIEFINKTDYDIIWIYPNILYAWYKRLIGSKVVMTGPDCSFLHYELIKAYAKKDPALFPKRLWQIRHLQRLSANSFKLETRWARSKALLHVVGAEDQNMYDRLSMQKHSFFSFHPHSSYEKIDEPIGAAKGKLTLLISGPNNSVYTGSLGTRILGVLTGNTRFAARYKILIIGKGFGPLSEELRATGYEVEYYSWVDNYESAIKKAHIQVFPIVVGTGTKGKVLCAMATGLLCIGTRHAFENIQIEPGKDAILISHENELSKLLDDIDTHREKYSRMAKDASIKVRTLHSPVTTSKQFWDNLMDYWRIN